MMRRSFFVATGTSLAIVALLVACDQVYADPVTSPAPVFGGGRDSGFTTNRTPASPCPRASALENSPCYRPGAVCEYGSSPDPDCNTMYRCTNDQSYGTYWTEDTTKRACPFKCPDPAAIVDGAPCDLSAFDGGSGADAELQCQTTDATCACTTGPDSAHQHERKWVCRKAGDGCPVKRPLLGQVCVGDFSCDYGQCDFKRGARMACIDEVWQIDGSSKCP
jgi:hypothetical protein